MMWYRVTCVYIINMKMKPKNKTVLNLQSLMISFPQLSHIITYCGRVTLNYSLLQRLKEITPIMFKNSINTIIHGL